MTPWQEKRGTKEVTVYTERTIEKIIGPLDVAWFRRFPDVVFVGIYRQYITEKISIDELDRLIETLEEIRRCVKTNCVASKR
jgi:hypothetical protein